MKFCSKRGFKNLLVASTLFVLHDRLPEPTISVIALHKLAIVLRLNFAYLITEGPLVYSFYVYGEHEFIRVQDNTILGANVKPLYCLIEALFDVVRPQQSIINTFGLIGYV